MAANLKVGPFPVGIHLSFFLTSAFLAMERWDDPRGLCVWVGVAFVSVLIHEFGHAVVARAFGLEPRIDLHGMGGTTTFESSLLALSPGRSILISVAGPFAGLLTALSIWIAMRFSGPTTDPIVARIVTDALVINGGWSIINLLPMLPLDGGNVARDIFRAATGGKGERGARILSVAVAVTIAILFGLGRQLFAALLFAMFAYQNVARIRQLTAEASDERLEPELAEAARRMELGRLDEGISKAEAVLREARSDVVRANATQLLAYGQLLRGDLAAADAAIAELPAGIEPAKGWLELRNQVADRGGTTP